MSISRFHGGATARLGLEPDWMLGGCLQYAARAVAHLLLTVLNSHGVLLDRGDGVGQYERLAIQQIEMRLNIKTRFPQPHQLDQ